MVRDTYTKGYVFGIVNCGITCKTTAMRKGSQENEGDNVESVQGGSYRYKDVTAGSKFMAR